MWRKKSILQLIKQKLDDYINSNNFPRETVSDLIKFVRHSPQQCIKPHLISHLKVMDCIKWLILIHNLNYVQIKNKDSQIEALLQLISPHSIQNTSFDGILFEKMIKPYKAYLLKRNTFNLKEIDQQFHCYALINIIKQALSFTSILFTLGRYLFKKYNFLIDFNIIMARDLSYLYKTLKFKMDEDFHAENLSIIENINQGMYTIYYNCYFNKYVSHIAPDWIEIDLPQTKSNKQLLKTTRMFSTRQIKTQKEINIKQLQVEPQHQVSIAMDQSSLQLKDQLKSISTIASHRQTDYIDDAVSLKKEREHRERREFIFMAESILQSFKENQEDIN